MSNSAYSYQINIPADFFLKEAKQEYSGSLMRRLLQEFLQNSFDAKSTFIGFSYDEDENYLTVLDNGCGMDLETLQKGLLTLGGSIKNKNECCGSFGAAKKLLIASHEKYQVKTGKDKSSPGILVNGAVNNYNLGECEPIKGTEIKIWLSDSFPNFCYSETKSEAIKKHLSYIVSRSYLGNCYVFFGEDKIDSAPYQESEYSYETAQIRSNNFERIIIRFNGLYMFEEYSPCDKGYYYDCAGHSSQALTQNREGFRSDTKYKQDFDAFYLKISENKVSGLKAAIDYERSKEKPPVVFNGIKYAGPDSHLIPAKMSKRHRMIYGVCAAVYSYITGKILSKDDFGFWYSNNQRGLCADAKMWINPTFWEEEWTEKEILKLVEVFIHEYTHWMGDYNHDEKYILSYGDYWVKFLEVYSGIAPLKKMAGSMESMAFSI